MIEGIRKVMIVLTAALLVLPCLLIIVHQIAPARSLTYSSLAGMTFSEQRPRFSVRSWTGGEYQGQFATWFNQRFGLRELFIRWNNQIYYTLFEKSFMYRETIIIGKEKQLYERVYLDDYTRHVAPMTPEEMDEWARQIAIVQDLFGRRGVAFLVLITPSKASIYPEYIPGAFFRSPVSGQRSYDLLLPFLDRHKINYVDGQRITLEKKGAEPYPLFCRGGTHWNYLGAYYTIAQLVTSFEALTGKATPRLRCDRVDVDMNPAGTDKDLASLLNLAFPPFRYTSPHPVFSTVPGGSGAEKSIAFVGGSFIFTINDILWENRIFDRIDFYFYYRVNHFAYPKKEGAAPFDVGKIDWNDAFLNKDVVVLEVNVANLPGNHTKEFVGEAMKRLR